MPVKVNSLGAGPRTYKRKRKSLLSNIFPSKRRSVASKRRSKRSSAKAIFLGIITIIIATFIIVGVYAYQYINAPFTSAGSAFNYEDQNLWKKDEINLLFIKSKDLQNDSGSIERMGLVNFDLVNKRYRIYNFPFDANFTYYEKLTDTSIEIPVPDVFKKSGSDEIEKQLDFTKSVLDQNLAVQIDGYILIDNNGYNEITDLIGEINYDDLSAILRLKNTFKIPALINTFRNNTYTNLSFTDVFEFLDFIKNTSDTSSSIKDLNRYNIADTNLWDEIWQGRSGTNETVKKERTKVLVLNASQDPKIGGLAKWGSRVVKNLGGSVLDEDNAFFEPETNQIITKDENLEIVKSLVLFFGDIDVVNVSDIEDDLDVNPIVLKSDVTLVLVEF